MRRTLLAVSGVLLSASMALPVAAQTFATPNPMSQKYRDTGAKPATGRAGSAAIEIRALLGLSGATELEVTTGQLEAAPPVGSIAKAQVKLLTDGGEVLQADNFRKTLTGNGYASFTYDGLRRGQVMQVQANVTGIDPNRTDVVTVSTNVKLRPDLEAVRINAPAQVLVNSPVTISGVVSEVNGDVGARSTCRLLADGVEVGSIPGIWVDANSTVTCQFQATFGTIGTRQLSLRVTNSVPVDDDAGNNVATASLEVIDPQQPFNYMQAWASDYEFDQSWYYDRRFTRASDGAVSTYNYEGRQTGHTQSYGAYGQINSNSPLDSGQITLRHSMDGVALPMISVAVADLPLMWGDASYGCRWGYMTSGVYAQICSGWGSTDVYAQREAGDATYFQHYTVTGDYYGWASNWDYSSIYAVPGMIAFGTSYVAELQSESPSSNHSQSLTMPINYYVYDQEYGPYCWSSTWSYGTDTGCDRSSYHSRQRYGYSQAWN